MRPRGPDRRGLGSTARRVARTSSVGGTPFASSVAVAVVLGCEVPSHTPVGTRSCEATRSGDLSVSAWTRPRTSCLERAVRYTGHRVPYCWSPFGR